MTLKRGKQQQKEDKKVKVTVSYRRNQSLAWARNNLKTVNKDVVVPHISTEDGGTLSHAGLGLCDATDRKPLVLTSKFWLTLSFVVRCTLPACQL